MWLKDNTLKVVIKTQHLNWKQNSVAVNQEDADWPPLEISKSGLGSCKERPRCCHAALEPTHKLN